MIPSDVLIIGASVGGLTVAEALRHKGFRGRIRIVGDEPHPPYDRPPLSKEILTGKAPAGPPVLRTPGRLDALDAKWLLGRRAVRLRHDTRVVELDDGRALSYDVLVIATGSMAKPHGTARTLRTVDDALALRAELHTARHVAVLGAGVLGCEVAAAARTLGRRVTLIGREPVPMAGRLGPTLGAYLADLHRDRGVRLRTGSDTGDADLVVAAVGSEPATGWLDNSGLRIDDGVRCDSHLRAAPSVYAVGDVARWSDHPDDVGIRLETRTNATEQGLVAAANILGADRLYRPVPYFWTEQYEIRIQVHGVVTPHARIRVVDGDLRLGRFLALAEADGTTTAAIGWNHPLGVRQAHRLLRGDLTTTRNR
ncbi:NAD(P)/FAD-dependent oxidoreductase [Amycolatopsis suaedae]|uniref:NAD(P)/FAD-dependent oxidoreductase n=1 Tax=Amycolatopsis suaedae TaxID=2510978 RepID=A0A4Q7J670_9PSEU|nr:FAD-dependent oxidoreductase [Amycolatopsis suaedae]RZQ62378.1 NAD(P)/FAD-dependent oxidoreductase [Amycolatopsis suaedae]